MMEIPKARRLFPAAYPWKYKTPPTVDARAPIDEKIGHGLGSTR